MRKNILVHFKSSLTKEGGNFLMISPLLNLSLENIFEVKILNPFPIAGL